MTEIRYYPLINCDSEGTEKMALFPTLDQDEIVAQSDMWLEEMVPNYFRLCIRHGSNITAAPIMHCPRCGKKLTRISENISNTRLGLYVCGSCEQK